MGHYHDPSAGSQNVGNHLGSRPCVRLSKLYRKYESGNNMKALMGGGESTLWNVNKMQGAYSGAVYDHEADGPSRRNGAPSLQTSRRAGRRGSASEENAPPNPKKSTQQILQEAEGCGQQQGGRVAAYGRRAGKSVTPPMAPQYGLEGALPEQRRAVPRGYERGYDDQVPAGRARASEHMYEQASPQRRGGDRDEPYAAAPLPPASGYYDDAEAEINAKFSRVEAEINAKYESELREMAARALRAAPPPADECDAYAAASESSGFRAGASVPPRAEPVADARTALPGQPRRQMISQADDAIWSAVTAKDVDEVRRCIASGANVNSICPDGWTRDEHAGSGGRSLLHHAAWSGHLEIFRLLHEAGAEMLVRRQKNWAQPRGNTPFHAAAFYGRGPIVQYCLEHGADVNMQGEQGHTALHLASMYGYHAIARMLLACGARTDMLTKNEKTPTALAKDDEMRGIFAEHAKSGGARHAPLRSLPEQAAAYNRSGEEDPYMNRPRAGKSSTSGSTYANHGHGIIPQGWDRDDDAQLPPAARTIARRERAEVTGKVGSTAPSAAPSAAPSRLQSAHGRGSPFTDLPSHVTAAVGGLSYAPGQKATGVMATRPW